MPNLRAIHMEETIVGYLCPECRSPMASGLYHGGEERWFYAPHCSECSFEVSEHSVEVGTPFEACIPAVFKPETLWAVEFRTAPGVPRSWFVGWTKKQPTGDLSPNDFACGGTMWEGAVRTSLDFRCDRRPEESDMVFFDRACTKLNKLRAAQG